VKHLSLAYKKRICRAMNHISANLHRDLPLSEIAGAANFSMFHFHRIFKALVAKPWQVSRAGSGWKWQPTCSSPIR